MIITKLKIGIITAAISLIAIPTASAHALSNYKRPVIVKIAHILDIKVNVLENELKEGDSIMEIAKEFNATKSEIKEIKKVLRLAKPKVVKVVKVVEPVVVKKVVVKHVVVKPVVVKKVVRVVHVVKVVHVKHIKRPVPVKKIAAILDTTPASVRQDLRQGDSIKQIAKENHATKHEMKQLNNLRNRRTR